MLARSSKVFAFCQAACFKSNRKRDRHEPAQDAYRNVDPRPWLAPGRLAPSGGSGRRHAAGRALRAQRTAARYNPPGSLPRTGRDMIELEPTMLLPALAMVTSHIGLVTTASTIYNEPYIWRADSPPWI